MANKDLVRYICAVLTITMLAIPVSCAAPEQKPGGEFEVVSLNVIPSEVSIGEEAAVTVKIANIGKVQGNYTAVLTVNDVEFQRKDSVIPAQDIVTVTFSLIKYEAGTYRLAIDGSTASLSVSDPMQAIRSAWKSFEPLADAGLVRFELLFNLDLYNTGALKREEYWERRNPLQVKMIECLNKAENQPLRQAFITGTGIEYSSLYIASFETAMNELRSSLSTQQKSTVQQELQTMWQSLEPLAEIELLSEENIRDGWLEQAEKITETEYYTRTANVSEKINSSLDKLGNKNFTEKFTAAWFESPSVKKWQLWIEFMDMYESLFSKAMEDFSQKLSQ